MRVAVIGALLFALSAQSLGAQVKVRGYVKKDGTYVQPHYRSRPDSSVLNNWSTRGNINPYTGATGRGPAKPFSFRLPPSAEVVTTAPVIVFGPEVASGVRGIVGPPAQETYSPIRSLSSPATDFSPE